MTVGTEGAAAAESIALSELRPQQTGAEKPTGCEKARNSTDMPAEADMSQLPETGTDMVTDGTDLETDMSDPAETEALRNGMAETAGKGQGPRIGIIGAGLITTERMQTGTDPATDPSAKKLRGKRQAQLMHQAALSKLILARRCALFAAQHYSIAILPYVVCCYVSSLLACNTCCVAAQFFGLVGA